MSAFIVQDNLTKGIAEITFDLEDSFDNTELFLEVLKNSVYYWLENTESGQELSSAMKSNKNYSFSLFDLAGYGYMYELTEILRLNGIYNMDIRMWGILDNEYTDAYVETTSAFYPSLKLRDNLLEFEEI